MNLLRNLLSRYPLLAPLLGVVGFLLLAAGVTALVPSCEKQKLVRQQTEAKAEHTTAQAQGQAAQNKYQRDSTALAGAARLLRQQDSILALEQRALLHHLSTRRPLPAWSDLPRAN